MAITIRADESSSGVDYNTYLASYFADVTNSGYSFNGGTPDSFYGQTFYMNGPQVVFDYETADGEASDNVVVLGGEEIAYDYIHHGAQYGHGMSGAVDSLTFGATDADTTTNGDGLLEGYQSLLEITGLGIDDAAGTGTAGELSLLWNAITSGDYEYIYEYLASEAQIFIGSDGDDSYTGTAFADTVRSGAGDDEIDGGAGADTMSGGAGDDVYGVDDAGDVVKEAADGGLDTVKASVSFTLGGAVEALRLVGTEAIDGTGNGLDNFILGNDAENALSGAAGADRLVGGLGDDTLSGGAGRDVLLGGDGADTFAYASDAETKLDAAKRDVIKDFVTGTDVIDLSAIDANAGKDGNQKFSFLGESDFTGNAGELVYRAGENHVTVFGDTDGDGSADFAIKLAGITSLAEGDFLV